MVKIDHPDLAITWEKFYVSYRAKPKFWYCADGDGFIVIRETKDGFKLFEQGEYIKTFTDLIPALSFAEHFMQTCGYAATFENCRNYQ